MLRPTVNMGAAAAPGEDLGSAGWEWFGKHVGAPLKWKTVTVMGQTYLWSVEGWKPGAAATPGQN